MAINKKLIHFNSFDVFNTYKLSANSDDTQCTIGINDTIIDETPDISWHSIVFIKDTCQTWTHGQLYNSSVQAVDIGEQVDDVAFNMITAEPAEGDSEELEDYVLMKSDIEHIIPHVVEQTDSVATIQPNVLNVWGEVASLDITLAEPTDNTIINEYMVQFTSGDPATRLELPIGVKWMSTPNIQSNKTYQLSIINNLGVIGEFNYE